MHLGIDASNLRLGGGVTHLSQILSHGDPVSAGFEKVTVWACQSTIDELPIKSWLEFQNPHWTEADMFTRLLYQQLNFPNELLANSCDVLFSPGGSLSAKTFRPVITMSQNMLPFESTEVARFGVPSFMWLKMKLLRLLQGQSFNKTDGLIFLTCYAKLAIQSALPQSCKNNAVIPHGIEARFFSEPRPQKLLEQCSVESPFRLLYVSIVMPYKHQITIANAVNTMRAQGVPVEIVFIGASWGKYGAQFRDELLKLDPEQEFLHWPGAIPYDELHESYFSADAFVFGSSCENLPNIVLEAMAAGLPIAASNRGPMPEILGDSVIYFDPEESDSICYALIELVDDPELRMDLASKAFEIASNYSWEKCAHETFKFIADTVRYIENK